MKRLANVPSPGRPEQRLVYFAKRRIARYGIHGAEIRTIARLAGTSTSRFHDFFQCRDNLFAQVFSEGWELIERHINQRLLNPSGTGGVEGTILAVISGVLDALDEDPDAVGATIVLGLTTIGQPVRERLKESPGFVRYQGMAAGLSAQLAGHLPEAEASEAVELIFGGVTRRLFLLTPMCSKKNQKPFDRDAFLNVVRQTLHGLLAGAGAAGEKKREEVKSVSGKKA